MGDGKKKKRENQGKQVETTAADAPAKLKRKAYEKELAKLHVELVKLQEYIKEAGLRLLRPPVRPRWSPYLNLRPHQRLESWQRFAPETRRRNAGSM